MPSIGFASCSRWIRSSIRSDRCEPGSAAARARRSASARVSGRNSCSGGSSSRIVTASPSIARNIPTKSPCCIGASFASAARATSLVVGEDHLAHRAAGAPRPRTCAPSGTGRCPRRRSCARPRASSGVSAFARTPRRRISSAHPTTCSSSSLTCGGTSGHARRRRPRPSKPSRVSTSPSPYRGVADPDGARPPRSIRSDSRAGHARLPHPARDDRRVARHAAVRRQHALRRR